MKQVLCEIIGDLELRNICGVNEEMALLSFFAQFAYDKAPLFSFS